jgi:hypothetical protein
MLNNAGWYHITKQPVSRSATLHNKTQLYTTKRNEQKFEEVYIYLQYKYLSKGNNAVNGRNKQQILHLLHLILSAFDNHFLQKGSWVAQSV